MSESSTLRLSTIHTLGELEEAYGNRTWSFYRPLLAQLIEFAPPGRVLDAGTGTGLFAECCRRFGIPCIGLEGADSGARMAHDRGVPTVVARLESPLPFPDESFASVVLNQVIEHLYPDTARFVLREVSRVLRPGGVVMIQSPSPRDARQRAEPGHVNLYLPSRLRGEVQGAGFEVLAERNGPILPFGRSEPARLMLTALLKVPGLTDLVSASANVVARRPGDDA